jgi:hypothetical protein
MKLSRLIPVASLALVNQTFSADPAWWTTRGVKNASSPANYAIASVGQAKHIAAMALAEIENRIPAPEFALLNAAMDAVVDLSVPSPLPPDWGGRHRTTLLVGELKAIAKPIYDHIRLHDPNWLDAQMILAETRKQEPIYPLTYSPYPWTESTADDTNKAACTVGQLKAVFSIDFSQLAPAVPSDRDGDGTPDKTDAFPDDPTRHHPPPSDPLDTTGPVISLIAPEGATAL